MALKKITDNDLAGKGVIGMEDTPNLPAREMQEKVEEVVRSVVIPFFNANVDETVSKQDLAEAVFNAGSGDMHTAIYDADKDGVVDNAKKADNGIHTYTHTKTGTVHYLIGSGDNIKFTATADWNAGDTLNVLGVAVECYNQLFERLETEEMFRSGATVMAVKNGEKCFFKTGGAGIPDGLTVTPVNNILKWQKCAGLKTGYTTIEQILADTRTLKALINSANAMEYLIRSVDIQAAVLADENAVSILDASMPFITPSMRGVSNPYGTVTRHDDYFKSGTYLAFNYTDLGTDGSNGSAHGGKPGAWVQYSFAGDRPVWLYKSQIRPTYVNSRGVIMRVEGVLEDGTFVRLSDDIPVAQVSSPNNTPTVIMHRPNSYRCKAVRFFVVDDGNDGSIYFNGGKVWGK